MSFSGQKGKKEDLLSLSHANDQRQERIGDDVTLVMLPPISHKSGSRLATLRTVELGK